jgi:aconitate hydratase
LGVRAVIAAGYERIHRSNLVGMGVLPLQFLDGQTWQSLGLTGEECFDLPGVSAQLAARGRLAVRANSPSGDVREFEVAVRIDSPVERDYYRQGGILPAVLRRLLTN